MSKKRLLSRAEVDVNVWEERDRLHIAIVDKKTGQRTIAEWWDDDARQMFEDGFFKRGVELKRSVIHYAEEMGLLSKIGRNPGVRKNVFVFNNPGNAQRVLAENFVKGANSGVASSLYIHGNRIYSYGPHFPIAERHVISTTPLAGTPVIIITSRKSPSKTTSGQIGLVKAAAQAAGMEIMYEELKPEAKGPAAYSNPGVRQNANYLFNPKSGVRENVFVFNNPRDSQVEAAARAVGLYVGVWSPGDGTTRYRFFTKNTPGSKYADYHQGDGIYTALGRKDALSFIVAYRMGRNTRRNPLTKRETSSVVESARFHARMARSITPGAPYRSHLLGVAEGQLNVASQYGRGRNRGRAGTMVGAIDRMAMAPGGPHMRYGHRKIRRNPASVLCNPSCKHDHGILENPYARGRERRSYQEFLARKQAEYGSQFDPSDLDPRFISYYENGKRIWVSDFGHVTSGTVGVTTGWRPVFLLMSSSRARGSSTTLTRKTKILGEVGAYKPRRGEYGQAIENPLLQTVFAANPPVSEQWNGLSGRQRLELLMLVGFPMEYASSLAHRRWTTLVPSARRALEAHWMDMSSRGTTRRRVAVGANPLTRKESAQILARARHEVRLGSSFQRGHTRSASAGQAWAHANTVEQYGPRSAGRAAAKLKKRAMDLTGTTLSNPGVRLPKPGTRLTVSQAFDLAKRIGDRALIAQCEKALKLQKAANKNAKCVIWKTFAMGSPNKIDSVVALTHYGDSPETMYRPPKGSKKGPHMYRHKWGEGGGGKKTVPLLASADGKMLLMPLEGRKVASDWLRH